MNWILRGACEDLYKGIIRYNPMGTYSYLKINKLTKTYIIPLVLLVILILWSIIINILETEFLLWLNTLGLFFLTLGAIFAIRPIIRTLLNPRIIKEESKIKRDVNAGLMAFHFILSGFAMQFISLFYELVDKANFGWKYSWFLISFVIMIIVYFLFNKRIREFKLGR